MENNNTKSALLVMDMITGITDHYPDAAAIISRVAQAIAEARARKLPVIYVALNFRQGTPEINPVNKTFGNFKKRFGEISPEDFSKIVPELASQSGDVTVLKRRVSAFTGSDLEVILRAQGIQHLILTGIATSGVVLSTTREAADKDYSISILSDCCADRDPELHHILMTKVLSRQAEVLTLEEWSKA